MATYDWPTSIAPREIEWGTLKSSTQFRSQFNGTGQAVEHLAERFVVGITLPPCGRADSGLREAFFSRLAGGVNWVRVYHFGRPSPLGTMRGSPTLLGTVTRGADQLALQTTAGATLLAGDLFACGGQLFQVAENATANGSGAMSVSVVHRVRMTTIAGAAVTWDRPTATFSMPSTSARFSHVPSLLQPLAVDLMEEW